MIWAVRTRRMERIYTYEKFPLQNSNNQQGLSSTANGSLTPQLKLKFVELAKINIRFTSLNANNLF